MTNVRLSITFPAYVHGVISDYASVTGQTKSAVVNEVMGAACTSLQAMTDLIIQMQSTSEEKRLALKNELSTMADDAVKAVGGMRRSLSLVAGSAGDSTPIK